MKTLFLLIMLGSLGGLVYCFKKRFEMPNVKKKMTILFPVFIVSLILYIMVSSMESSKAEKIVESRIAFAQVCMNRTARYISENFPNSRILVIRDNPELEENFKYEDLIGDFKENLSNGCEITSEHIPEIPWNRAEYDDPEDPRPPPLIWNLKPKYFDEVIRNHPECDLLLTLIGFPEGAQRMSVWRLPPEERPKVVMVGGYRPELLEFILYGKIDMLVRFKSFKATSTDIPEPKTEKELEDAFNSRYIIIDKSNVDSMMKK